MATTAESRKNFGKSIKHREQSMDNWFRKPPIQRQKWGDSQVLPHVNWGDLFFDLFYVAGAYNLAYIIKAELSAYSVLYVLGCFGPLMFFFWFQKLYYDSMFQAADDILHVSLEILQLCVLAMAVLHIRPVEAMSHVSSNPTMFIFCLSCWLNLAYGYFLYLEIRFWGVKGQRCAKPMAVTSMIERAPAFLFTTIATIYSGYLYLGSTSSHGDVDAHRMLADESEIESVSHIPIILMLCGAFAPILTTYPTMYFRGKGGDFKDYSVPMNISYVIHRYGEFTMLMLGESILSLLIVDLADENIEFYFTFLVGVISVILLQYMYFKSQPPADGHAMRRSRLAGIYFGILSQFYSAALIVVGVSYKLILTEYKHDAREAAKQDGSDTYKPSYNVGRALAGDKKYPMDERRQRISYFFCAGLAVVFVCMDMITLAHKGFTASVDSYHKQGTLRVKAILLFVFRLATIVFIATAWLYVTKPNTVAVVGLGAICIQVSIQIMDKFIFPHKTSEHEEAADDNGHNGSMIKQKSDHFQRHAQPNMVDSEVNYNQWPNTSQAMAIPEWVNNPMGDDSSHQDQEPFPHEEV